MCISAILNLLKRKPSPENTGIRGRFDMISRMPYDVDTCNCTHKTRLFGDYLLSQDAKDVYIVIVSHESGKYNHTFIEWQGRYFDPTATPPQYNVEIDNYLATLQKQGFQGAFKTTYMTGFIFKF